VFNLQKKQTKKYLHIGIPIVVFFGIVWKISDELTSSRFKSTSEYLETHILDYRFLALVVLCSFLNWSLESIKWQSLVRPIEKVTFVKSLSSVIAGLSIGFFTPRSIGDYLGRALLLESSKRFEVLGGLLVSRVSQMLATVVMGVWGVFYLKDELTLRADFDIVLYISLAIFILILLLFFFRKVLIEKFMTFKHLRKVAQFFSIIKNYQAELYSKVLLLSVLRYATFLIQFILVALMLQIEFSFVPFVAVVCAVLLLKSVVVSFNFFSDLGMREFAAVMLFPTIGILSLDGALIGFIVWVFNVLMPSVLGSFMVLKAKW